MNIRSRRSPPINCVQNNGENGYILFAMLIFGTLIMIMALSAMLGLQGSMKTAGVYKTKDSAFNIAEAGKEHALSMLRRDSVRLDTFMSSYKYLLHNFSFSNGLYSVLCKTDSIKETVTLRAEGMVGNQKSNIEAVCYRYFNAMKNMRGVIISRSFDSIGSYMTIDGRNYDTNGVVVGSGVSAIYSSDTFRCKGLPSIIGSTQTRVDTTTIPQTPEAVFCLDSGAFNSYVTTDPISTGNVPVSGADNIIYWKNPPHGASNVYVLSGRGVLICHNDSFTATLSRVMGTFKGIIIVDKWQGVAPYFSSNNLKFSGAIFILSGNNNPNVFDGNVAAPAYPKGNLKYSSQIIRFFLEKYAKPVISVTAWKEL